MDKTSSREMGLPVLFGAVAVLIGLGLGMLVIGVPSSMRLLVIVLGVIVLMATVAELEWGLFVLIFLAYTRFSDILIQFHGVPSIAKSYVLLLLVGILVRWLVHSERPTGWERPFVFLSAFGLVGFASLLYAENFDRAWNALQDFTKDGLLVLIIGILLHSMRTFRRVSWTLILAGILLGTITVYQAVTGTFSDNYGGFALSPMLNLVGDTAGNRASGPIGDPNFYAQIMLVIIPIALDRLGNEKQRLLKFLAAWGFVASVLTVVFTYSRGAFLAMVVMVVAMVVYRPPRPLVLVVAAILLLAMIPFIPRAYISRLQTMASIFPSAEAATTYTTPAEVSFRGRASEVIVGWLMFVDHPLLGVGINHYPLNYQQYSRRLGMDPRTEERSAHNLYLEIAAERGLMGLGAFVLILWELIRGMYEAWRAFRELEMENEAGLVAAFAVGVIGYLAAAMFIHDAYPRYLWVLVGIGLAIPAVARHELGYQKKVE